MLENERNSDEVIEIFIDPNERKSDSDEQRENEQPMNQNDGFFQVCLGRSWTFCLFGGKIHFNAIRHPSVGKAINKKD